MSTLMYFDSSKKNEDVRKREREKGVDTYCALQRIRNNMRSDNSAVPKNILRQRKKVGEGRHVLCPIENQKKGKRSDNSAVTTNILRLSSQDHVMSLGLTILALDGVYPRLRFHLHIPLSPVILQSLSFTSE